MTSSFFIKFVKRTERELLYPCIIGNRAVSVLALINRTEILLI